MHISVWKGTKRGFWRFSRAKNPFSLPFQTPATQAKFHVRCGYTKFPLEKIAWVCSGFWSLSCLWLHPEKLLKVKSKLEHGFAVNVPVNIEDWHKLYKALDDYYLFDKTLAIAVKAIDILWLCIRRRRHHLKKKNKKMSLARTTTVCTGPQNWFQWLLEARYHWCIACEFIKRETFTTALEGPFLSNF